MWSSEARRISHACCKPTADAQTAGHGRGRSPEVQSSKARSSAARSSAARSSAARSSGAPSPEAGQQLGVQGHRVQRQGSSSEFWGTESRGRAAARSSGAPSPEAGQQLGVLGHRVQRQGSRSAGRKSVNEFKNGKSACFVIGGCRQPLCAPPSRRRKGRDGDPRLAQNGPGGGKFPPVTKPYDKLNGRAAFSFPSFLPSTYNTKNHLL